MHIIRSALTATCAFLVATAFPATITWTNGAGTGVWNNAANWSSGTIPGVNDVALFDGSSGANCAMNVAVNVQGILVNAMYTGILTQQAGIPVTVGTSGYIQHGATFQGGNADITLNAGNFTLTGGSFTTTSGALTIGGTRTISQTLFAQFGGTFDHNNGSLVVTPYCNVGPMLTWTLDVLPTTVFYDVVIKASHGWTRPQVATAPGDVVNASHDLRHIDGYLTGQFAVGNDLEVSANADGGTGLITVDGNGAQSYSVAAGSPRTCRVEVDKPSGSFTPAMGTTDFSVQAFSLVAGDFTAPSGDLNVGGTWTTSQTLFSHSGGTYAHNNGTLMVNPYCNVGPMLTWTLDVLPTTVLYDVTINANQAWTMPQCLIPAADSVHVDGILLLSDGRVNGGTLDAHGAVQVLPGYDGGNARLLFHGSGAQTFDLSGASGNYNGDIGIDKPAGNVQLLSDLVMDAGGQDLQFAHGDLLTTANEILIMGDNVACSGASDSSFVDGPMRKVGNDAFTFPIGGEGIYYAPIRISAPGNVNDAFTAEYFHDDPQDIPYDVSAVGAGLDHVSRCEYWDLERTAGSSNVRVTLGWAARSCGVNLLSDLCVARWNGSQWDSHGNGGTTGTMAAGTVITHSALTPTAYGPFTLGSTTSNNPLPVELLSFDAWENDPVVDLKWVTATEHNNAYFVVERTVDGLTFEDVDTVQGAGNSVAEISYTAVDPSPHRGISYYRLRQVDLDGTSKYSELVAVDLTGVADGSWVLYPNPSVDGPVWLTATGDRWDGPGVLTVVDGAGRVVEKRTVVFTDGPVELMKGLHPEAGMYSVHVVMNGVEHNKRLIIQ